MRWKSPKHGDYRIERKFLWYPRENPDREGDTRWLEYVNEKQLYHRNGWWLSISWEDNDETD